MQSFELYQAREHALDLPTVARYVKDLRDRQPHDPMGLGTGAGLPPASQPLVRPTFYMPYPSRSNRYLEATRAHATAWARSMGMLDGPVWTPTAFEAMDFALFTALTHPEAPAAELELINDWYLWGRFVDDLFAATFEPTRDQTGALAFAARLPAFLPADPAAMPEPVNPAECGLADLWIRSVPRLPAELRLRLSGQVAEFAEHRLWELGNVVANRVPDPVDYLETRRRVTGFAPALVRLALGERLPREIVDTAPLRALLDTFCEIGPLRSDIFRYPGRLGHDGEINNGVRVVQRFLDCGPGEAVHLVNDLTTARLLRFDRIVCTELPALLDDLSEGTRRVLLGYVEALQDWLAGDLQWSQVTGRYRTTPGTPQPVTRLGGPAPVRAAR